MTLALRVVAVIIAAYACADLSYVPAFVLHLPTTTTADAANAISIFGKYAVVLWSIPMIVALLLWWLAPRLARLALRGADPSVDLSGVGIERLTHAAFVIVGVWILVFDIIGLARTRCQ